MGNPRVAIAAAILLAKAGEDSGRDVLLRVANREGPWRPVPEDESAAIVAAPNAVRLILVRSSSRVKGTPLVAVTPHGSDVASTTRTADCPANAAVKGRAMRRMATSPTTKME